MDRNHTVSITQTVHIDASAAIVFAAATDWNMQSAWMIGTKVAADITGAHAAGGTIQAFSGIGRFGFTDTMTITSWNPPYICEMQHTGRLIRGSGRFEILPAAGTSVLFCWHEELQLPFGSLGRAIYFLCQPIILLGIKLSLHRFKKWSQNYSATTVENRA